MDFASEIDWGSHVFFFHVLVYIIFN